MEKKKKNKKKRIDIYLIILLLLMFVFIGLMIILIYLDNNKRDIDNKIANLNKLNNEIIVLRDNYGNLKEIDKKIKEVTTTNNNISNEIEKITNNIKYLDGKIALYRK